MTAEKRRTKSRSGKRFDGRVAIVTGAASGIGRATAVRLAAEGASVIAVDIQEALLAQVCDDIVAASGVARSVCCDIGDEPSIQHMTESALEAFGRVDILANVAGISPPKLPVSETTVEELLRVVRVNLVGPFLCIKHASGPMKAQRYGRIVNVSSVAAIRPTRNSNIGYAASKGGIDALTRQLVWELSPYGITINSVAPGVTKTPLTSRRAHGEGGVETRTHLIPVGRIASADELAASIAFLASEEAGFVNGTVQVVDGGMTSIVGYSNQPV